MTEPVLSVRNLEKRYPITEGLLRREVGSVRAVDGVSFDVHPGEAFGLVGESGCGKSTTARTLLGLEEPTGGEVRYRGENVADYGRSALRAYRRQVQLVLQDPDSAFNPQMTVGEILEEPLRVHGMTDAERRRRIVTDALERVGLSGEGITRLAHEFSGGQKQRIALARALVLNPDVIVADEPVSALDGRTKANVLELMSELQSAFDLSVVFISHDIDVVDRFCDRIGVMYLGRLVECGETATVLDAPHHPYTRALVSSVPSLDPREGLDAGETLTGTLPDASDIPSGCRFHPRCESIIRPEDVSLPPDAWRSVAALAVFLADDWNDAGTVTQTLESGPDIESRLRTTFGLPESLPDGAVDTALAAAGNALENGELSAAREQLEAVTATVCKQESPLLSEKETTHAVACHRYDPHRPGDPLVPESGTVEQD